MIFHPAFSEIINYSDHKMNQLSYSQSETKTQRQISAKNLNLQASGSNTSTSNASNSSNGVYVDLGKALLEAAKAGDADKVQECIKNGAPFITDWLGTSALHVAARNNYFETCGALLRSGISKDAKTKVDRTPLHFAVFEGNFEICQLLIQHECSVDPLDMLRMTPLHWAVEKAFDNIAELLIESGANPHIQSKFLKTPYSIAKDKNNDYIINLIEMLPTTPMTPSLSSAFDSSVFIKTPTTKSAPKESQFLKDEPIEMPSKRARFHSYDAGVDSKQRLRGASDAKNMTLQLLQEQMNMMSAADDNNLIQSALQSGRKIMLSEAGKRLLNDSNLNKFLKIPLNTTISSSPSSSSKTLISPRATTTTTTMTNALQRRTSDSSDILEIFHDGKKSNNDILSFIRSSGSDLQEVTITQRSSSTSSSSSKPSTPVSSPIQKTTGISLSAITVPKARAQSIAANNNSSSNNKTKLPSTTDTSVDLRTNPTSILDDFSRPEVVGRKYSELFNNYQQLKRAFEREQQKNEVLLRQVSQLQSNFELYKRQQQQKFDSILFLLQSASAAAVVGNANGNDLRKMSDGDVL